MRPQRWPLALALLAALALTACSFTTPVREGLTEQQRAELTPEQVLWVAEADYLINKADFLAYARQPLCAAGQVVGCHDAAVVAELGALNEKVRDAFRVARGAVGAQQQGAAAAAARILLAQFATQVALIALKGE